MIFNDDLDAIRSRMSGVGPVTQRDRSTPEFHAGAKISGLSAPSARAALIAAEQRAWDAYEPIRSKADDLFFAWREVNPDLDEEDDLLDEITAFYEQVEELEYAADALYERIVNWVPDNLPDCIELLEFYPDGDNPRVVKKVLAGLRIIVGAARISRQPTILALNLARRAQRVAEALLKLGGAFEMSRRRGQSLVVSGGNRVHRPDRAATGDRHRVRELIREWIVYPFGTRMRDRRRPGAPRK